MNSKEIKGAIVGETNASMMYLGTTIIYPYNYGSMPAPAYTVPDDEIWYIPEDGVRDSWLTTGKTYHFTSNFDTTLTMISETRDDSIIKCKFSDKVERIYWNGTKNVSLHYSSAVRAIFNYYSSTLYGSMKYVKSINSLNDGVYNTLRAYPAYYALYEAPCTTLYCYWGTSGSVADWVNLKILDNCSSLSTIYNYAPYPLHPLGNHFFTASGEIFTGGVIHYPAEHADLYQAIWMEGKSLSSPYNKYTDGLAADYDWTAVADL